MKSTNDYHYELPQDLIAQYPLEQRDQSRLMVIDRQRLDIAHYQFFELPQWLHSGDCLVLNDTRVLSARLIGHRVKTGGKWEGLFLGETSDGHWRIICQTRGKLKTGERIALHPLEEVTDAVGDVDLELISRESDGSWLATLQAKQSTEKVLNRYGRVPLPPYVKRETESAEDRSRYQTVYGCQPGAVAAPTAGLHFTEKMLEQLRRKGVEIAYVTLHVGRGTFKPITTSDIQDHQLHHEWGSLPDKSAQQILECRERGGKVVAVGTTTLRLLESVARAGRLTGWSGETDLYIRPPYNFRAVDCLLTNFHLPKTTLLVLVSAFAGNEFVRQAYQAAIEKRYRFFSYGDAMLIR